MRQLAAVRSVQLLPWQLMMQFLHRLLPGQCYYLPLNRLHFAFSYPKVDFKGSTAIDHGCFTPNWFAVIISAITGATLVSEGSSDQ